MQKTFKSFGCAAVALILSSTAAAALNQSIIDAAKKEGSVTLYSAASADATAKICTAITQRQPCGCFRDSTQRPTRRT